MQTSKSDGVCERVHTLSDSVHRDTLLISLAQFAKKNSIFVVPISVESLIFFTSCLLPLTSYL